LINRTTLLCTTSIWYMCFCRCHIVSFISWRNQSTQYTNKTEGPGGSMS
jgi:hypothetical protein